MNFHRPISVGQPQQTQFRPNNDKIQMNCSTQQPKTSCFKTTPMSIDRSRITIQRQPTYRLNNYFNSTGKTNFIAESLHNNELEFCFNNEENNGSDYLDMYNSEIFEN